MSSVRRKFGDSEKAALLKALSECRKASVVALDAALFDRKDVKQGCAELQKAIDNLAEMLTGNFEYFWGVAHSSDTYLKPDGQK